MAVYSVIKVQPNQGQPWLQQNYTLNWFPFLGHSMSKTGHRMSLDGLICKGGQVRCRLHQQASGVVSICSGSFEHIIQGDA